MDYEHTAAVGVGTLEPTQPPVADDFGRGVALWHDATLCQLSETASGPGGGSEMDLTISFLDGASPPSISRVDGGIGSGGEVFPRAIVAGNPWVDGGDYDHPILYTAGAFSGEVMFGFAALGAPGQGRSAFVTREFVDRDGGPPIINEWAAEFTSSGGVIEALAVAAGPLGCPGGTATSSPSGPGPVASASAAGAAAPTPPEDVFRPTCPGSSAGGLETAIAVGGFFDGEASFPIDHPLGTYAVSAMGGTQDGYVALVQVADGRIQFLEDFIGGQDRIALLRIGSPTGATRVTGVAIDPKDYSVAVTGWFSAGDADFDPYRTSGFLPGAYAGGRDIFVAKYEPNEYGELFLRWLYVTGTEHDDEGASVAFDSSGAVYATGYKGDAWGNGDLWIARFEKRFGATPAAATPAWEHTYPTSSADDRGLGVAVDHLDRALIAGRFGYAIEDIPTYCLDFDPGPATDQHCTLGGADAFVMRFRADGTYDWGYRAGAARDDYATAIATEPLMTSRFALAGTFGQGPAFQGYTVDFDPGPGTASLVSEGLADSFASVLDPVAPEGVTSQVSLVLDNSGSMFEDKYVALVKSLRGTILTPGDVPTDGTVAINVVMFGDDAPDGGRPLVPWTQITPETQAPFAHRLARLAAETDGSTNITGGVLWAERRFEALPLPGAYRHVVIVADSAHNSGSPLPAPEVQRIISEQDVDQFSALCAFLSGGPGGSSGRPYALDELVESIVQVPANPDPEDNLGMAAEIDSMTHPGFPPLLRRFIQRVTVCVGDYDRNGRVDMTDESQFIVDAFTSFQGTAVVPYADWNFDGTFDGFLDPSGIDFQKFNTGYVEVCGGS